MVFAAVRFATQDCQYNRMAVLSAYHMNYFCQAHYFVFVKKKENQPFLIKV
jgi:hypothetical protein